MWNTNNCVCLLFLGARVGIYIYTQYICRWELLWYSCLIPNTPYLYEHNMLWWGVRDTCQFSFSPLSVCYVLFLLEVRGFTQVCPTQEVGFTTMFWLELGARIPVVQNLQFRPESLQLKSAKICRPWDYWVKIHDSPQFWGMFCWHFHLL